MLSKIINDYINKNLSEKRYKHSVGVAKEAVKLAEKYGVDTQKAYLAGIAHDMAKEIPEEQLNLKLIEYGRGDLIKKYSYPLLHGPAASVILEKEFSVSDKEVLEAVCYHTTGKEDMSPLTKVVYLADFIEPNRIFEGVDKVRAASEKNLDEAIIISSGMVIIYTVRKGKKIHPDTVIARNYLLNTHKNITVDF